MKQDEHKQILTILDQLKTRWNRKVPFRSAVEQIFRLALDDHGETTKPDVLFSLGIDVALMQARRKDRSWLVDQLKNLKLAHAGATREQLLPNRRSYDLADLFDQALRTYKRRRFAI